MTIQGSGFFNHYKEWDDLVRRHPSGQKIPHDKMYKLMVDNLDVISSLKKNENKNAHLNFQDAGAIALDKGPMRGIRDGLRRSIVQYSSFSPNVEQDLLEFTIFVRDYLDTYVRNINPQQLNILKTRLNNTLQGLENLKITYEDEGYKKITDSIDKSSKILNKALKFVKEESERQEVSSPVQSTKNYIDSLNHRDHLSKIQRVSLLKEQLDKLASPPGVEHLKEQYQLFKQQKKEIKEIDQKIAKSSSKEEMEGLVNDKRKIQDHPQFQDTESAASLYQELRKEYKLIFKEEPYSYYKQFVKDLKAYYPKAEDRSYLLANLMLNKVPPKALNELKDRLDQSIAENKKNNMSPREIKRGVEFELAQSRRFDEAIPLIRERREKKRLSEEPRAPIEPRSWMIGKATTSFIAAGGLAALAIFVPNLPSLAIGAAFAITPKLLESSLNNIKRAWQNESDLEKQQIKNELQTFVRAIKQNPQKTLSDTIAEFRGKEEQGQQVIEFIHSVIGLQDNEVGEQILTKIVEDKVKEGL